MLNLSNSESYLYYKLKILGIKGEVTLHSSAISNIESIGARGLVIKMIIWGEYIQNKNFN